MTTGAIMVESDDFSKIYAYPHRALLILSLFTDQLPESIAEEDVFYALYQIEVTEIVEVEMSVDSLSDSINHYVVNNTKLFIYSFCAAIIRSLRVNAPSLVENMMRLKVPVDTAVEYCKRRLLQIGIDSNDIGIFYMTPCAAKIAAVKLPLGGYCTAITGVLNMDDLYNRTFHSIK